MVLGGALGPGFVACDARGAAPLCVAGVALGDIHLRYHVAGLAQSHIYRRFAWQAWHLWYWVAPLGRDLSPVTPGAPRHFAWQAWQNLTSTFVSRGRRGTNSHLPPRHFAWQAWRNLTSTFVSRGRRGTISHLLLFCVAGVALMVLGGALGPGFVACDAWGATPLCVAGVALGDMHLRYHVAGVAQSHIYRRFAWHAWHLWYWVAPLGRDLSPVTPGAPRHFAWQAWHLVTSTFDITWQVWHNLTSTVVLRGRRGTYGTGWHPWAGICRL